MKHQLLKNIPIRVKQCRRVLLVFAALSCCSAEAGLTFSLVSRSANLFARYSFDDPAHLGRDDSGNGHDLFAFDIAPDYSSSGKVGGAAVFNGTTQGYQIQEPAFPEGSFSFAFWIKPNSLLETVIGAHSLSSGIGITVGPSEFRFFTRYAEGYSWLSGYVIPDLEQWQHLAMTFDSGVLKTYHNGILTGIKTNAEYVANSGNPLDIGHRNSDLFSGAIDDIRIYDKALTVAEVKALIPDPADVKLGLHDEIIPTAQSDLTWWMDRHQAVLDRNQQGNVDLLMIGDSITQAWEDPEGQAVWNQYYANRNAVNLGFGGDRTQQVLWRMQNGEIDRINPKLAVLLIGTNNTGTPEQGPALIADGIESIVHEIRTRLPNTKVLLMGIFPRGSTEQREAGAPEAVYNWQWEKIDQVNELISGLADDEMVFYLNINDNFLNDQGALTRDIAPDLLHLSEAGYAIWAAAMEPAISQLMDEEENEAVNRLNNPGFEYKSIPDGSYGNLPLYWTKAYYGATSTFTLADGEQKHGELSLKITDSSTTRSAGLLSDPVSVNPGYVYTARVWAMRSATEAIGSLYLRFYDSTGQQIIQNLVAVGSVGAWGSAELTMTAPPNAVSAKLLLYSSGVSTGTVYFDSASLVLADEEVWDGGFDSASAGLLPENWFAYSSHTGVFQSVWNDAGNNVIRLVDTTADSSCGAYCKVPVTPGVPYRLSADVAADSCGAGMDLQFYSLSGTQLGSYAVDTTSSVYAPLEIEQVAPERAAYAKVVLYTSVAAVGEAFFDNVSFQENYTVRYVAPAAQGNGSGLSATNAALYTSTSGSTSFWYGVNTLLASNPVKVVMLEGDYSEYWVLGSIGNETNHLLISGETPYAVNYSDLTTTNENYFIYLTHSKNITLRHLHFTADEDPATLALKDHTVYDYRGVLCVNDSQNISFEGLTWTDMLLMSASASSVWAGSHDITWTYCNFVTIGWDLYDHCIYNVSMTYNLDVEKCYFQDCNGVYVRYRSGSKGSVLDNIFLSTGSQNTGDPYDRRHWSFIQFCAFNTYAGAAEILGDKFFVSGNSFTFENTQERGYRAPFQIYPMGVAPVGYPTNYHLVPLSIGAEIEDTGLSAGIRNEHMKTYFGIDLMSDYKITTDNSYAGCWPLRFIMNIWPTPHEYVYWTNKSDDLTPTNNCNLDALLGLE